MENKRSNAPGNLCVGKREEQGHLLHHRLTLLITRTQTRLGYTAPEHGSLIDANAHTLLSLFSVVKAVVASGLFSTAWGSKVHT